MSFYIGIDVGTGSARAGIFDADGVLKAAAKREITLWQEPGDVVEQSSENIWQAIAASVREAMATARVAPADVAGIGFDATCSLVLIDADDKPVTVSRSGDPNRNIIVWMDHRATEQTRRINATKHPVLSYVGGVISPEMETPKLAWLREHLPQSWSRAARFLDLPDFLSYRATGNDVRSLCTTVCKWTYLGHDGGWDEGYFRAIGLGDLADEKFLRIGARVRPMGEWAGGLTPKAAEELGLAAGTVLAVQGRAHEAH